MARTERKKPKTKNILTLDSKLRFPHALLIDASAGSGKTHTLTLRFVQFLLSSRITRNDLTNLLAVTFTNNAAREMKQRVLEWLKTLALGIDGEERFQTGQLVSLGPDEITRRAGAAVEQILDRFPDLHIQTIDSFMNRVLRASAHELGLPLEVAITESYEGLVDEALEATLQEIGGEIPFDAIERFLDLLNSEANRFIWRPVEEVRRRFGRFLQEEGKVTEELDFADRWTEVEAGFVRLDGLLGQCDRLGYAKWTKDSVRAAVTKRDVGELIDKFDPEALWFMRRRKNWAEAKSACPELASVVGEMLETYARTRYTHFGLFYRRFKAMLEKTKRKQGVIHFDDINKKLASYISQDLIPEIYYRLGDTLYHFLLDEFQDTDWVQWENIKPLLEEAFAKEGSFFAVGDMKQAIYMFRKADYRIMYRMARAIKEGTGYGDAGLPASVVDRAEITTLEENFRSGGVILEYVARIFKDRLPNLSEAVALSDDRTGLTRYEQHCRPGRKAAGRVKTVVLKDDDTRPEKQVLRDILADVTKRYALRDITILSWKNDQVETVVEWLTEWGIKAASFSSLDIKKRKLIMEITSLLQFLDSPIDNLGFAGFILGDVFARAAGAAMSVGPEAIREFLLETAWRKSTSERIYVHFKNDLRFSALWAAFFEDIFNKVGYYPLYELVSLIFRRFRVFENFPEEAGFLVKFLEAISQVEGQGLNNIKDFVEMVGDDDQGSLLNIMLPDYVDAVRVMTFHKAKGLGFPVVVNMIYDGKGRTETMHFERDRGRLDLFYLTGKLAELSPGLRRIYREKELNESIQKLNLLYVANTRAESELYNVVVRSDGAWHEPYIDLFQDYDKGAPTAAGAREASDARPLTACLPPDVQVEFGPEPGPAWSVRRLVEAKRGEFYHHVLSLIEFASSDVEAQIENLVTQVARQQREPYDGAQIKRALLDFLNYEAIRPYFAAAPGRSVQNEVEYVDAGGSLYRCDRVVSDSSALSILDFKTTEQDEAAHEEQLRKYLEILRAINPDKKVKGLLAFIEPVRVREVS